MTKVLRVGLVQQKCGESPKENLRDAKEAVITAADSGAQLICLQELFSSRYFCQTEDSRNFEAAEEIPGPITSEFSELACLLGVDLVVPIFERRSAGLYHNSAVILDRRGEIVSHYRKMHIPDDPHYYEKYYFSPGDLGYPTAELKDANVGTLICWDQWFPEAARLSALGGAEVLVFPTAIGWHENEENDVAEREIDAWMTIQRSHAIANGVFVIAVNRVGKEGSIRFWGSSFVADPTGTVVAQASDKEEAVLIVDCDLRQVEEVRREWPFLRDRRIDSYHEIYRRFRD
ncbi:carbon-nitrogen hydrolase [Myxococcota bacterium]|nr:carbon-nitrogen hydrolase [Myxococcota bacterium]|tara:strand:+ start:792 stop:1658 length:867 start_codon:yes stop_codon:yes gene_type:complete